MRIENLSIKTATIGIIMMLGIVSIVLSILAGGYFKKSALDAQMGSLSRVIEVAAQEVLREAKNNSFDLGMKLGHSKELINAMANLPQDATQNNISRILDDPFLNGFVGFAKIDLEKIRVYGLDLNFIAESNEGIKGLNKHLSDFLIKDIGRRQGIERLKAIDALLMTPEGPLLSSIIPIGGLHLTGYLEIIVNPVFNLSNISNITQTPISIYSSTNESININTKLLEHDRYLPINFILHTSDQQPAFRIVGHENVNKLNSEMNKTQFITISSFLLLSLITLAIALQLFNRFLFAPLNKMVQDMEKIAHGRLDLRIDKKGLRDFFILANTFNSMTDQVRVRTNDLEHLLDLEGNAILCFGNDYEAVYFNKISTDLFGYDADEIADLEPADLFIENIAQLMHDPENENSSLKNKQQVKLQCTHKDGHIFECDAIVSLIDVQGDTGYAIILSRVEEDMQNDVVENSHTNPAQNEQRIKLIEKSLHSLLEIAKNDPVLLSGLTNLDKSKLQISNTSNDKLKLREQAVTVMRSSLTCWEHDLGKSKLDLAEDSRIWPVYLDKSTPTTRTLDKYLHIDSCPKNPRIQRVIDTAEFVLKAMGKKATPHRQTLEQALDALRLYRSGA